MTKPGTYTLTVTDACNTVYSDAIMVKPANAPTDFLAADTVVCSYEPITLKANQDYINYLWNNGTIAPAIVINTPGTYWLQVTDNNNCFGRDTIIVASKTCIEGIYFPSAFTPNNDGLNDVFKPLVYKQLKTYDFKIFNRFGQIVFHSKKTGEGWNGQVNGIIQPEGAFVWVASIKATMNLYLKKAARWF